MVEKVENIDWLDLITRPLSEAELVEYQDVLGSDAFQDMVRVYHANSALSAMRQVLLAWFGQGISLESMITALANIWLDCLVRIEPRLDDDTQASWRRMPQLLVQVLFQQAMDVMQEHRDQLSSKVPIESEEMYKEWAGILPKPLTEQRTNEAEIAREVELTLTLYQELSSFRAQLEASELKLDAHDFLEAWRLLLLQTFIFTHFEEPDLFFVIDANWDLFLPRLSEIVGLMVLLKGAETMLLPENRSQLTSLIAADDFQDRLKHYLA